MIPTCAFDELHSVSDLHLGGEGGFQIFSQTRELAWLLRHLADAPADRRVGLVINGDFVDFLAEQPSVHFDPSGAITKLDRILRDPTFAPVFEALAAFARAPNRTLVVNLGNHDIELALPWVRDHLLDALSGGDPAARARIRLNLDGTGFACRVGDASVLFVHGNEVDAWNVVDHERIRRIARDLTHGLPVDAWRPNAGTRLVIDVMNQIKRHYPFVDLLKPELEAVVPILVALQPEVQSGAFAIAGVAGQLTTDKLRRRFGLLGGDEAAGEAAGPGGASAAGPAAAGNAATSLQARLQRTFGPATGATGGTLLERAELSFRAGVRPLDLVHADQQQEYLGVFGAIKQWIFGADTSEVLRAALDGLMTDRSFEFDTPDATYTDLDAAVAADVDFLIAGHTHLERALPRRNGSGAYFNSGTWARLIRLRPETLADAAAFAGVFEALQLPTLADLDRKKGIVTKRPTVVSVWRDGAAVHGELRHVAGADGAETLLPLDGTRFTR